MIIKFIDVYFETKLSIDSARQLFEKYLEEHIRESSDFYFDHFIDMIEESGRFELLESNGKGEFDIEYTQNEIEIIIESITDETYVESDEEDNDYSDDDEEDNDYSDEDDDEI